MNKKDIKLIVIGLIVSVIAYVALSLINKTEKEIGIVEYQENTLFEFDLEKNEIYEFEGTVGKMHLEVMDGNFRVVDVECPNHQCEQMGWHDINSLTPIVCMPNEVIIYVK